MATIELSGQGPGRGRRAGVAFWASAGTDSAKRTAYNTNGAPLDLPPAIAAERRDVDTRAGRMSYYVAGDGPPLLLIHSINAGGSAYEVRPIFERTVAHHRTYALDLPGFGFSDRSPRDYSPRLYTDAIHAMTDVIAAEAGPRPVDALALSLSSEFLARAASERPSHFRSLALVTPTGFQRGATKLCGPAGATREVPGLRRVLGFPLWDQGLYRVLTSRRSIRFFLKKTWGSDAIDEGLADYDYLTSHQPDAKHAVYAFASARLFSGDIRSVYERLTLPVWVPHGTRGDFKDFSEAGWTATRSNWTVQPYDAGALPQFELPDRFHDDYRHFLAGIEGRRPRAGYSSASGPRSPSP